MKNQDADRADDVAHAQVTNEQDADGKSQLDRPIRRLGGLRGQSRIRYSLPPPGFIESGVHLASAPWIPLDSRIGIHKMGQEEPRFGIFFSAARIAHVWLGAYMGNMYSSCVCVCGLAPSSCPGSQ